MAGKKKTETALVVAEKNTVDFDLSAEIVAGKLTSNAKELAEKIRKELKTFTVERYLDNPESAKSDKAILTKVKETISDKRKEVSAKWNEPLNAFLDEMKSLEKDVSNAYDGLNDIVKQAEKAEKEKKRKEIETYWHTLGVSIVTLDRIFNPKWLNKTFSMTDVMKEVEQKVEKIMNDLATINLNKDEDTEILRSIYLETLDLNAALEKNKQLKANREKVRIEAEKENAEKIAKLTENSEIQAKFAENLQKTAENVQKTEENVEKTAELKSNPAENDSSIYRYRIEVSGTREQLLALRAYIDKNKISYQKF